MTTSPRDQHALLWNTTPAAPRQPKPGELLFEFVRHHRVWRCELRFHGESYGWEAQFFDGDLHEMIARGGFATRDAAVQWADLERADLERDGTP